ncbi:MAG: CapA family protein [Bacteroidales bacterium]|nr:CapA family protein [Bacteroidales bacterium]
MFHILLRQYLPNRIFLFIICLFLTLGLFPQSKAEYDTITLAAVGDIMLGTSFPDQSYLPPGNNPLPLISSLFDVLSEPDLTFGNLEGPFSDSAGLAKKCRDTTKCYAFRVPESYAGALDSAGFDLLSIANNHIGDFGYEAKQTTAMILDSLDISYAGTDEYPWTIRIIDDTVKVGFCAFAPNKGTVNLHDENRVTTIVSLLEDSCDIVIVSVHGGGEGAAYQNVTREEEFYYGENRGNIYEFAHRVIDLGADVVLGHGPHVSRALEIYRGRIIAYSLGNFSTYRRFNLSGPNGYAPVIYLYLGRNGEFLGGKIIPVYQNKYGHVKKDPQKRAIFKIRELIMTDFPESEVLIDDNGYIILRN